MIGIDALAHPAVVGAPSPEVVVAPYRAVVSPRSGASTVFGELFPPSPPDVTAIDRVVVTGGKRWVPYWDRKSANFDAPLKVEVRLRGGVTRAFSGAECHFVQVFGGRRVLGRHTELRRISMGMIGIDAMAGEWVGVELSPWAELAANLAKAGAGAYDQSQKDKAAAADAGARLKEALAADQDATLKVAAACFSAELAKTDPKQKDAAEADRGAADDAIRRQAEAGAGLPEAAVRDRVKAAQAALTAAREDLQKAVRAGEGKLKLAAQCRVSAAQATLDRARGVAAGDGKPVKFEEGEGFLSRKVVGPVKVWHLGAVALIGGGGLLWWKLSS